MEGETFFQSLSPLPIQVYIPLSMRSGTHVCAVYHMTSLIFIVTITIDDPLPIHYQETSLRPEIRHGTTAFIPSRSVSPAPISSDLSIPTPPINIKVDYSSPFLCRLDLSIIRGATTSSSLATSVGGVALLGEQMDHVSVDVGGVSEVPNQSHLTKVVIGCEEEEEEPEEEEEEEDILASLAQPPESPEEILMQVRRSTCTCMSLDTQGDNCLQVHFFFFFAVCTHIL